MSSLLPTALFRATKSKHFSAYTYTHFHNNGNMILIVPCLQLNVCQYHLLSNETTANLTRLIYVECNKLGNKNIIKQCWRVCSIIASTFSVR